MTRINWMAGRYKSYQKENFVKAEAAYRKALRPPGADSVAAHALLAKLVFDTRKNKRVEIKLMEKEK